MDMLGLPYDKMKYFHKTKFTVLPVNLVARG